MLVINISKKNLNKYGYKDFEDWSKDTNNLYIGRNVVYVGAKKSKWANPFSVKEYGRDKCLELYKNYVLNNKNLMDDLFELKGKTLGCWCSPEKCHGDILIDLVKQHCTKHDTKLL